MIRILIADRLSAKTIEKLSEIPEFEVVEKTELAADQLKEEIRHVEAVVVGSAAKLTKDLIANGAKLQIIVRAGIGLDNVDADFARSRNIEVCNTPGATSITVAEYTLAQMLNACRFIGPAFRSMKEHRWEKKQFTAGIELHGKTAGIIGLGRIGKELAQRLLALGMQVIFHDLEEIKTDLNVRPVSLDELLQTADFISIHLPLTDRSRQLISHREFALMKKSAVLVNVSHGGVVDEVALLTALQEERIRAAVMDVFAKEPSDNYPLIDQTRLFPAPHLGASTLEGQERAGFEVITLLKEFFNV